jgi:hypothetical protein
VVFTAASLPYHTGKSISKILKYSDAHIMQPRVPHIHKSPALFKSRFSGHFNPIFSYDSSSLFIKLWITPEKRAKSVAVTRTTLTFTGRLSMNHIANAGTVANVKKNKRIKIFRIIGACGNNIYIPAAPLITEQGE